MIRTAALAKGQEKNDLKLTSEQWPKERSKCQPSGGSGGCVGSGSYRLVRAGKV